MDLCVECKAEAECPSSVDMAKIKFEFLTHYYEKHPVPLRAKLFADIARASRLASGPLAPLANVVIGNGLVRKGLENLSGSAVSGNCRSLPVSHLQRGSRKS